MLYINSKSELDAFKKIYIQLLYLSGIPEDKELIKETSLACEIDRNKVNSRILISEEGELSTNIDYSIYIKNGNELAKKECIYWYKELFASGKVPYIIEYLKENTFSKRAISMIWKEEYMNLGVVASCVSYLFFRIDNNRLNMNVHMRANDAYNCLLIDMDILSVIQNYVAKHLNLEIGMYNHFVDSLHFYKKAQHDIYPLAYKLINLNTV